MPRALFFVLHRKDRSPGQRYRHEQYVSYLESMGIACDFSPILNEKEDTVFYSGGHVFTKMLIGIKALGRRLRDVGRANHYDYIYVYRDAFFFGTFIEKMLSKKRPKLIYDFDDAIWLMDKNPNQGFFNMLKNPKKTARITSIANQVIVGNEYLKQYAMRYNENTHIIPSTIDFEKYQPESKVTKDRVCIGWTGSFSTIKHFETILPALERLQSKYGTSIYFKLIGDPTYSNEILGIKGVKWSSETEVEDLAELDIGLMPLPDNEWTRGKCAMKGLQYMALAIPTVMSPVGVNAELIQDGANGFLASSEEDWVDKISQLIDSNELCQQLGEKGKETVQLGYSVEANKNKWLEAFSS